MALLPNIDHILSPFFGSCHFWIFYFLLVGIIRCNGENCSTVISYPTMGNEKLHVPNAVLKASCPFVFTVQNIADVQLVLIRNNLAYNQCCWEIMAGNSKCFNSCESGKYCKRHVHHQEIQLQAIPEQCDSIRTTTIKGSMTIQQYDPDMSTLGTITTTTDHFEPSLTTTSVHVPNEVPQNLKKHTETARVSTTGTTQEAHKSQVYSSSQSTPEYGKLALSLNDTNTEIIIVPSFSSFISYEYLIPSYSSSMDQNTHYNEILFSESVFTKTDEVRVTSHVTSIQSNQVTQANNATLQNEHSDLFTITPTLSSFYPQRNGSSSNTSPSTAYISTSLLYLSVIASATSSILLFQDLTQNISSSDIDKQHKHVVTRSKKEKQPDSSLALGVSIAVFTIIIGVMFFLIFRLVYRTRTNDGDESKHNIQPRVRISPSIDVAEEMINPCFIHIQGDFSESTTDDDVSQESETSSKSSKSRPKVSDPANNGGNGDIPETTFSHDNGCFNMSRYTRTQQKLNTFGPTQSVNGDVYAVSYKQRIK